MSFLPLVLLAAMASVPCTASRCVCMEQVADDPSGVVGAYDEAGAVVLGRVIGTERIRLPGDADDVFGDWREVTLDVERRWKGEADTRLRIRTPWHAALCGFPFENREVYLVYARIGDDGRLVTDACMRTRVRERADDDIASLDRLVGA